MIFSIFKWCLFLFYISSISATIKSKLDLLPKNCGYSNEDRLIGGTLASLDQYPWTALLQYRSKEGMIINACHASLISKRYLVTAAHCLHADALKQTGPLLNVVLGENDLSNEGFDCESYVNDILNCADKPLVIPFEKYILHPNFDLKSTSRKDDIAVIRLAQDVTFSGFVSPICMPEANTTWKTKETRFTVAGWGIDVATGKDIIRKRHAGIPYVDLQTCQEEYKKFTSTLNLVENQVCAGGSKGPNLCRGIGGGPLMQHDRNRQYQYELVGVFNLGGSLCGTEGVPAVYTKVLPYRDWILEQMEP